MIMPLVLYAGAAAARQYLYDLDLFAGTGVLDKIRARRKGGAHVGTPPLYSIPTFLPEVDLRLLG